MKKEESIALELSLLTECSKKLESEYQEGSMTDDEIYSEICDLEDITRSVLMELEPTEERYIKDQNKISIDRQTYEGMLKILEDYQGYISRLLEASEELIDFSKEQRQPVFTVILGGKDHEKK